MGKFIVQRLIQGLLSILVVTLLVFIFLQTSGDPVRMMLPEGSPEELVEAMRSHLGLDQPLVVQYGRFLQNVVRGDFGDSFRRREPAAEVVWRHLPATVELALAALVLSTGLALVLGVLAAVRRGGSLDVMATSIAILGQSVPVFWLGMVLILIFSIHLGWFPFGGRGTWRHLVMPAIALGWYMTAVLTRMIRSSLLEVLGEDYIRTARSKGLSEWTILCRHALKNAAIPVLTVWGLQAGNMLTGALVTETVFAWPGVGRASIDAVLGRDYPVVMASVALFTVIFVGVNLLVDIAYARLDPRIRYD